MSGSSRESFYALLAALLTLPFHPLLPVAISRYLIPILVFFYWHRFS